MDNEFRRIIPVNRMHRLLEYFAFCEEIVLQLTFNQDVRETLRGILLFRCFVIGCDSWISFGYEGNAQR